MTHFRRNEERSGAASGLDIGNGTQVEEFLDDFSMALKGGSKERRGSGVGELYVDFCACSGEKGDDVGVAVLSSDVKRGDARLGDGNIAESVLR